MHLKALRIYEEAGDDYALQMVYFNLGTIYRMKGELDKAEKMIRKSLEVNERMGKLRFAAMGYIELGWIYRERNDKEKEREYLQKAVELFKSIGAFKSAKGKQGLIEKIQRRISEL
jgi:tetratricopeptide (TPR) repeat protein